MVFFTCHSCGECVKKAHVEKHYLTECHSCEVLSCMDCGKDFVGNDYKYHTKCISENEKYGGKDYRATAKPNKGEVKQSQWIESVQAVSSSQSTNPRVRSLLNRLADFNNIPRKKTKFEKFIQNSLKVWDASLIEQVWAVFSEAGNKQKTQTEDKSLDKVAQPEREIPEEGPLNGEALGGQSNKHSKKKKKDKHQGEQNKSKDGLEDESTARGLLDEGGFDKQTKLREGNSSKKKNKKKKDKDQGEWHKSKDDLEVESSVRRLLEEGGSDKETELREGDSIKKKKKKKDKDQHVSKNEITETLEDEGLSNFDRSLSSGFEQDEAESSRKKQKKKRKKGPTDEAQDVAEQRSEERVIENQTEHKQDGKCSKKDKRQYKKESNGGHLEEELKVESASERADSDGNGEGKGLGRKTGGKRRKTSSDQVNGDGKIKKSKRHSNELVASDEIEDGVLDGLLFMGGRVMDGLLLASEKKKTVKKSRHASPVWKGGDADKVEKSEGSAFCVSEKKKKKTSKHKDSSTADKEGTCDRSEKKKWKIYSADVNPEDIDQVELTGKKKKKKKQNSEFEIGVGMEMHPTRKDEIGNTKQGTLQKIEHQTKKTRKRKHEVDAVSSNETPVKKKQAKDKKKQIAHRKRHKKKSH
ncbi:cell growth-regulating nucleolar protein-like isoform X2 [Acanthaster planci]|nr:cell growth-regulating nucleolar protein-like isoform X2 [Acanthaster planci]XP_022091721.1 cell growth-regulating nucleolar protein-like isoform X2 [Acanthaster planci]